MKRKLREIKRLGGLVYFILFCPGFLIVFLAYLQELKKIQGGR